MADPCPLFDKLPAELRNEVYQLAFTSDSDEDQEIRLVDAAPPSKAILMTCKQAHAEAAKLYKTMYQDYWRKTKFYIDRIRRFVSTRRVFANYVPIHRAADIEHISNVTVRCEYFDRTINITLEDKRGLWKVWDQVHGDRYEALWEDRDGKDMTKRLALGREAPEREALVREALLEELAGAPARLSIKEQLYGLVIHR